MLSLNNDILYRLIQSSPYPDQTFFNLKRVNKQFLAAFENIYLEKSNNASLKTVLTYQIKFRSMPSQFHAPEYLRNIFNLKIISIIFGNISNYENLDEIKPNNPTISKKIRRLTTNAGQIGFAAKCDLCQYILNYRNFRYPNIKVYQSQEAVAFIFDYDTNSKYLIVKSKSTNFKVVIDDLIIKELSKFLKKKTISLTEITPSGCLNKDWKFTLW